MKKHLSIEEYVSQYLDKELSDSDNLEFENDLAKDTKLQEEYNFQNELIEGIKDSRRLELKSRLSNIPIHTPLYQTIGFKILAVASISVGIGIGAYYLQKDGDNLNLSDIDIINQEITLQDTQSIVPDIPAATTVVEKTLIQAKESKKASKQEKPTTDAAIAKNTSSPSPKIIEPNVIQPDVVETFDDNQNDAEEINLAEKDSGSGSLEVQPESTVEIKTIKDRKNKFHYKFSENKLYLLGDFNNLPYEIIELNASKGKTYFLYYNSNYYKLNKHQTKATPLIKIENDSLVNELKIIQSKNN